MSKDEIKAELLRSACEDANPWFSCDFTVFGIAADIARETGSIMGNSALSNDDQRTFFLLVAEYL
jgi:hypothetical protein